MSTPTDVEIRRSGPADDAAVLELLSSSLGWRADDRHRQLFVWKHEENPFGQSPGWVATVDGHVVGFRTFLRWELVIDGEVVPAVRAVDTATHPDHRGKGVFGALTEHAVAAVRDEGVALVFNTPNDQSRPGYLKMGWQPLRRLPVRAMPRSPVAMVRMAAARTPADKWSLPATVGSAACDYQAWEAAAALAPADSGVRTHVSPVYLAWRYGFAPLHYRIVAGPGPGDGMLVVHVRRRGQATEVAVCEELVPDRDPRITRRLLRQALAGSRADYAVRLGDHLPRAGCISLPARGPMLVCRDLGSRTVPGPPAWHLGLGDIELF